MTQEMVAAKQAVWEGTGFACLARLTLLDGTYITQAALSTITRTIYDLTANTAGSPSSVTIASAVFDTLQDWPAVGDDPPDNIGYNFNQVVAHDALTTAGDEYRIAYTFTPVSGEPVKAVFDVPLRSMTEP